MGAINRTWFERNRPYLEFYFSLWPVIRIQTQLISEGLERDVFTYCRVELWLFKRNLLAFNLYKPHTFTQESPQRLPQRLLRTVKAKFKALKNALTHQEKTK